MPFPDQQTPDALPETTPNEIAAAVGALFTDVSDLLGTWRDSIVGLGAPLTPGSVDALVESLVVGELARPDPLFIGGGFIGTGISAGGAAPDDAATDDATGQGGGAHFSWWLGPFDGNPILGRTLVPTRLDPAARRHTEDLGNVRALEWYSIPETTRRAHVTGPYVDHLCTVEYILTLTEPVLAGDSMIGVVGVDVAVRTLEARLLGLFLRCARPLALLSHSGRVILSTDAAVPPGSLLPVEPDPTELAGTAKTRLTCPGTPFVLAVL